MPPILNEQLADKEVIKSLRKEIARLKGRLEMHAIKLFKDTDGTIKQAVQYDTVSRDEILAAIDYAQKSLDQANDALATFDAIQATLPVDDTTAAPADGSDATPAAPTDIPTVPAEVPATPAEQLADTTVAPAAPVVNEAPTATDGEAVPAAPTNDPTPQPVQIG